MGIKPSEVLMTWHTQPPWPFLLPQFSTISYGTYTYKIFLSCDVQSVFKITIWNQIRVIWCFFCKVQRLFNSSKTLIDPSMWYCSIRDDRYAMWIRIMLCIAQTRPLSEAPSITLRLKERQIISLAGNARVIAVLKGTHALIQCSQMLARTRETSPLGHSPNSNQLKSPISQDFAGGEKTEKLRCAVMI